MLVVMIFVGFLCTIMRILFLMIIQLFGLIRIDQSMMPKWLDDIIYLDDANSKYLSMVFQYHNHNNPIALQFSNYTKQFIEIDF